MDSADLVKPAHKGAEGAIALALGSILLLTTTGCDRQEPQAQSTVFSTPPKTQPAVPATERGKSNPLVARRLYIDSPDMEEIIENNIHIEAPDYGFEIVSSPSEADVVLTGSAGVFKRDGFLNSCVAFYGFEATRLIHGSRRAPSIELSLKIPNDVPCIRFAIAQRILAGLRDALNEIDKTTPTPKTSNKSN